MQIVLNHQQSTSREGDVRSSSVFFVIQTGGDSDGGRTRSGFLLLDVMPLIFLDSPFLSPSFSYMRTYSREGNVGDSVALLLLFFPPILAQSVGGNATNLRGGKGGKRGSAEVGLVSPPPPPPPPPNGEETSFFAVFLLPALLVFTLESYEHDRGRKEGRKEGAILGSVSSRAAK